ncbi:acyl-CoA thioesterase [Flavobacterium agricola]|uniref:Acyl-CoA thioesterase n=1 Tax=Flavobacterium agricola TaxID=2870839 RepID=A0ABY6M426_9FLAO|nr:acyl-CoA thioesterase [Flavobacterium agricola]UYW02335.1 acyl-CoA thioesterase [Flavobacterium agricola]
MRKNNRITFQFISEPTDVNFGGKVHGGVVMKWIDQVAYTCASTWAEKYCVTIYVGGIRFYKPINIGEVIKVDAYVIYTGKTSIHIAVDVYSRGIQNPNFVKKTHCVIVFVAVDGNGKPSNVEKFVPQDEIESKYEEYALRLKALRENIDKEMMPFIEEQN